MIPLITPELYIDNTLELKRRRGREKEEDRERGRQRRQKERQRRNEREGGREGKRTLYSLHVPIQYYLVNNSGSNTTIYGLKS